VDIVVDASVIIAVIVNEPSKSNIVQAAQGASLIAPASISWEIANAFSAMFKRNRITLDEALTAIDIYQQTIYQNHPKRHFDIDYTVHIERLKRTLQHLY
jgi:predicted nucleic acid-binding protein